ncbi:MAG: hypothetical protein AAGF11_32455 [Myxococcota bacterium]
MILTTVLVAFVSVLPVAHAEVEPPDALVPVLGPTVSAVLSDEERQVLEQICPQPDPESLAACLGRSEAAQPVIEAAAERAMSILVEVFGEAVVQTHGEALLSLGEQELETLANACPDGDRVACVEEARAGGIEGAPGQPGNIEVAPEGEIEYPEEALALLPREILDALPKALTKFLRAQDYQALQQACPQQDLEQVVECLDTEEVTGLLDTLHSRGVIASLLTYMDMELPDRLGPELLDALAQTCGTEGETWATCVFEQGVQSDACFELEDTLASCLIGDDRVTETYLKIQADKKEVFGPDLYVQFRGMMAVMALDDVRAMRERCPQQDEDPLFDCLLSDEVVAQILQAFVMISDELMKEANEELAAAGESLSEPEAEEYGERMIAMLLTFPIHALDSLAKGCIAQHPELETAKHPDDIGAMMTCIEEGSHTDPMANPAYISPPQLRAWLSLARDKVTRALHQKEQAAQMRSFRLILVLLAIFGAIGSIVVLLMPLRLVKRFPDRRAQLWKASAIAAGTFALTIVLLGVTLLVMRTVQGRVATESSSPKMVVAHGVFDVLEKDDYVDQLSGMSRERLDFIKTPLRRVIESSDAPATLDEEDARHLAFSAFVSEHWVDQLQEPELRPLVKNAQMLQGHVTRFKQAFAFYRQVDWIMGYVPLVLSLLAVVLYMIPMRETLVTIATAPAKAAEGGAQGVTSRAMATVLAEVKLVLPYLLIMVIYLVVSGVFLSLAVEPLIEILMSYSFLTVLYILLTEASGFVLYAALGGSVMLLVGCIAIYIITMLLFVGTVRKILRARFHWGQPLSRYRSFWAVGILGALGVMLLPVLFATGLRWLAIEQVLPGVDLESGTITAMDMLLVPLGGLLALPVVFWLLRGLKALGWIRRYPVVADPPPAAPGTMVQPGPVTPVAPPR